MSLRTLRFAILASVFVMGCKHAPSLVGRWESFGNTKFSSRHYRIAYSLTFRADGTFESSTKNLDVDNGSAVASGTYVYDGTASSLRLAVLVVNGMTLGSAAHPVTLGEPIRVVWKGDNSMSIPEYLMDEGTVYKRVSR